jgi:hypothetical protein
VVRVPKPAEARKVQPSVTAAKTGRSAHSGISLKDLDSLGDGEEVFEPGSQPADHGSAFDAIAGLDKRLLYMIFATIFLVTVFGLYVVLRKPVANDAAKETTPPIESYHLAAGPVDTPKPSVVPLPPPVAPATQPKVEPVVDNRPAWAKVKPVRPVGRPEAITDALVQKAIENGVGFLKSQFKDGVLASTYNNGESAEGGDALAVYALLHASQAINDPDLNTSGPFVASMLDKVKLYPLDTNKPIYGRSIRTAALSLLDRVEDREALAKDRQWLLKCEVNGAYPYEMPPPHARPEDIQTDNSTSQFGALGIWAAATAGQPVPDKYWADVEKHWLASQDVSGGWNYTGPDWTPTMTCAGVATLCVAAEYREQAITQARKGESRPIFSKAVDRGLAVLAKDDTILKTGNHNGYGLYTVERAALATGFRWFGDHDWYRELGATAIKTQKPNGAWDGNDGNDAETSFNLLFLSRGRQPLLMDKLRYVGDWDDRPRDVAKITQFASGQLEKPFAWGVADLDRNWWDWLESPVLFISMDSPPDFSDEQVAKLRSYTEAGGLIFLHNEFGSKEVDAFATDLAKRIFPAFTMNAVAPDDSIYSDLFQMKTKPVLKSVTNGSRTLMIYSPKDITLDWIHYRPHDNTNNPALQLGLNLFVAGAGKSNFRNRLNSPYVGPIDDPPLATVPVYQISYPGSWNPEPGAWVRFPRWFQKQTSMALNLIPMDIRAINYKSAPVALLTGSSEAELGSLDTHALRQYVNQGGVLFIDSTGGNKAFAKAVKNVLLPVTFPGIRLTGLPSGHPVLSGTLPCSDALPKPHVRSYTASLFSTSLPTVQYATVGKGTIIVSDLDVTTGLLDSGTYGINGYSPDYCQSLVKNVILWAMSQYHE